MGDAIPPPGAERDAEIARALGWTTRRCPPDAGIQFFMVVDVDGREVDHWQAPDRSLRKLPPAYSTDPAACDRLVEEMVRRGWMLCLQTMRPGGYYCRIDQRDGVMSSHAEGPKIADAVSAAALLALRGGR